MAKRHSVDLSNKLSGLAKWSTKDKLTVAWTSVQARERKYSKYALTIRLVALDYKL